MERLVDDLQHARVAESVIRVDNLSHPTKPLDGASIVVVVVEIRVRVVLARERLVGNLGSRTTVETVSGVRRYLIRKCGAILNDDVEAAVTGLANEVGKDVESTLMSLVTAMHVCLRTHAGESL